MRFLEYETPGSGLPPHADGTKVCEVTGRTSTHTLLLFLSDVPAGGETVLMGHVTQTESIVVPAAKVFRQAVSTAAEGGKLDRLDFEVGERPAAGAAGPSEHVLVGVAPSFGRVFFFPHRQPHAGAACVALPKVMLRAELHLSLEPEDAK